MAQASEGRISENFSKGESGRMKFLTCTDYEHVPNDSEAACKISLIAYQDLKTSKCYVALRRVKYKERK